MAVSGLHRLDTVERTTLSDGIVEKLITYIAQNGLQSGDMLPSEKILGEALGVSRLPLREAISSLRALGIISVRQGKGMFIRNVDVSNLFRQLSPIIRSQGNLNLVHMMEVRLSLEPSVASFAAERRDKDQLQRLETCIECMESNVADKAHFISCDMEFHQILAEASQNPVLVIMVNTIHDIISVIQWVYPDDIKARSSSLAHHKKICHAVADGDGIEAALGMEAHLREIVANLEGGDK